MAGSMFDQLEQELLLGESRFLEEIERYVEKKKEQGEKLTPDDIVNWMRRYAYQGDIFSMLIQGLSGHGKTTLALQLAARYYKRGSRMGWSKALEYTMFDPVEIIATILRHLRQNKIVPLLIFDDAGAWLSKWGLTVDKRFFLEFTNLLRTSVGVIIYTDIWSISKYIRDTVKVRVMVQKLSRSQYEQYNIPADTNLEWSVARLYITKISLKGPYYKLLSEIVFPLELPKRVRARYNKKRHEYTAKLAGRVIKRLIESRAGKRILKTEAGRELLQEIAEMIGEELGEEETEEEFMDIEE